MKKVLIITLEYPPQVGGIATYLKEFANHLEPQQTIVLAPKNKNAQEFDNLQTYKTIRKKFYFPLPIWPRWLRLVWQTFWICRKEKVKLVLIHHVLPVGYVGIIIKKLLKIPFLVFSHGTDIQLASTKPWKKRMFIKVARQAEQLFFNSESLRRRTGEIFPDFESKFSVLYPCPNQDFFSPPKTEIIEDLKARYALEGKKVMLTVGRMEDGKGYPHLLRIFSQIIKDIPNLIWLVIGDGSKRQWFLEEAEKKSLQSSIRYLGEISYLELKNYYYLADLFVLLTHPDEGKEEGLGLVFLEAAAAGLPVVAGKSGGVEEAVLHEVTGKVFNVYQEDKIIVENVVALLKNKELSQKFGQAGKLRMRNDFQWSLEIKKLDKWII